MPEKGVIPHLRGVVEHPAGRLPDDVFEAQILELGPFDQVVEVGDIGLVVLAVVKLERLLRQVRLQCVHRVR
jgi:hypothetical protein